MHKMAKTLFENHLAHMHPGPFWAIKPGFGGGHFLQATLPTAPNSKTVVVHFYSSIVARDATDHTPILMKTDGSEFVNFETSVVCLGALLTEDLRDDADVRSRICKVTQMFGFLPRQEEWV